MRSLRSLRLCLVAMAGATLVHPNAGLSAQEAESAALQFLPEGLLYESYRAGTKEARLSGGLLFRDGTTYFDAALGGRLGVLRLGSAGSADPEGWQLDLEAAAYPRLNLDEIKSSFESADFRFGFPLTFRKRSFAAKAGYYHISSHVGDEYLQRNPGFERVNYVRDSFFAGVSYDVGRGLRSYAEVGYAFYTSGGAEPWELQFGAEYGRASAGCGCGGIFVAINGHLREEFNFGGSVNTIAGWEWRRAASSQSVRLGVQYFTGEASQYEFFGQKEELVGLILSLEP